MKTVLIYINNEVSLSLNSIKSIVLVKFKKFTFLFNVLCIMWYNTIKEYIIN